MKLKCKPCPVSRTERFSCGKKFIEGNCLLEIRLPFFSGTFDKFLTTFYPLFCRLYVFVVNFQFFYLCNLTIMYVKEINFSFCYLFLYFFFSAKVPDADEEVLDEALYEDKDLESVEEHKSVILHLLSQLKLGMDLTKVIKFHIAIVWRNEMHLSLKSYF